MGLIGAVFVELGRRLLIFLERNLHPDIRQRHLVIALECRLLQHISNYGLVLFPAEAMQRRHSMSEPANEEPMFLAQLSSINLVFENLGTSIVYPGFAASFENTMTFFKHPPWRFPMM